MKKIIGGYEKRIAREETFTTENQGEECVVTGVVLIKVP